jgi:prepilin-type N-terminal cleavage/methylation domain-containing protein
MKKMRSQKGFTLVEIAIVLVIVGLLIGGILKGQEMVKSGKVKKATKQMEQLVAAINAYQDKNGKLPGTVSGTNDALEDLDSAKLITGKTQTNPFGGAVTAAYSAATGKITITSNAVPDYVAYRIDKGMDDGAAATGDMTTAPAFTSTDTNDVQSNVVITYIY